MFECERYAVHDGGDHHILVGQVVKASFDASLDPLLYFRGRYRRLAFRLSPCARHERDAGPRLHQGEPRDGRARDPRQGRRTSISTRCSRSTPRCARAKTEIDGCAPSATRSAPGSRTRRPRRRPSLAAQAKEAGARASALESELAGKEGELERADAAAAEHPLGRRAGRARRELQHRHPHRGRAAAVRLRAARPCRADREERLGAICRGSRRCRASRTYCLKGAAGAARDQADGLGAGEDRGRRLHADHRAGDRARPRPSSTRAISPATRKRPTSCPNDDLWLAGTGGSRADLAPFGRDHRGRQAADPLRRLLALLPPRGGERGQGRARAAARPPVRARSSNMSSARPTTRSRPSGTRGCWRLPRACCASSKSPIR